MINKFTKVHAKNNENLLHLVSAVLTFILLIGITNFLQKLGHTALSTAESIGFGIGIIFFHQLLMRWRLVQTITSDILCIILTTMLAMVGVVGAALAVWFIAANGKLTMLDMGGLCLLLGCLAYTKFCIPKRFLVQYRRK